MENWRKTINERVYSRKATVYHGTNSFKDIKSMLTQGYSLQKNTDASYGKALYATYDLENGSTGSGLYGDIVIKFAVSITDRFLVLDKSVSRKMGDNRTIEQKFHDLGLQDFLNDEGIRSNLDNNYTSEIAYRLAQQLINDDGTIEKLDGLIFTGRTDGPVLVVYKPEQAIMLAWGKLSDGLKWHRDVGGENILKYIASKKHRARQMSLLPEDDI